MIFVLQYMIMYTEGTPASMWRAMKNDRGQRNSNLFGSYIYFAIRSIYFYYVYNLGNKIRCSNIPPIFIIPPDKYTYIINIV